jgi:large subunit ribosomal protein L19
VHSPTIAKVDVVRQGKVRRAKLYYLRTKKGKMAKVSEREYSPDAKQAAARKQEKSEAAAAAQPASAVSS